MGENKKVRVYLTDHMVLFSFALAAVYWILDSVLYVFLSYDVDFFYHITGLNLNEVWTRLIVCCLFVIFGSHSQYTINKRKIIERQLQKSEEKYRTILENIEDGYFEINKEGRITFFNNALCNILGYISDEFKEVDLATIFDQDQSSRAYDTINDVWATGQPASIFDLLITRKDGTPVFTEASISLIRNRSSEPVGFRGVLRDVTERRKAESLEKEKSAAEYANKAKSEFLANMSHEIRTPLNAIIGLTELLVETELSERQKEDLNVVLAAAHSLLTVINDILDFSKIEAGKLELEKTDFNIRSLVEDSVKIMATKAHEKGLALESWIDPEVPVLVVGDPFRLRQILLNLVGNAIKFTDSGAVTTRVTCREADGRSALFYISVEDTGIGIAAENIQGIFGAFEQADGSTSRKYGGTGLGLAVSRQLVEMMGGTISVESQFGQGSTFSFTARCDLEKNTLNKETLPDIDFAGQKLMLAAVNPATRQILLETIDTIIKVRHYTTSDLTDAQKEITAAAGTGKPYTLVLADNDFFENGLLDFYSFLGRLDPVPGVIGMLPLSGQRTIPDIALLPGFTTITKPVFPLELIDAMIAATDAETGDLQAASVKSQPTDDTLPPSDLRILVAEDTPFNQKFITRLFERWHLDLVIVENGRQAVEKQAQQPFDIVLMDVQMPEMDGFEASRLIR
ncbi:MAG: PAS domain S-box protein, partial [Desulfobacterales bacterium]|nr:PAS domain S-box protein [Desulfobacterales bacterium]